MAAQAVETGLEGDTGADRRLGEDHGQGVAAKGGVLLAPAEALFGQLGQLEDRVDFVGGQVIYM